MNEIINHINGLNLGEIQTYKNLALAPLFGQRGTLDYLVLDEAIKSGLEIRETGSVPLLHFINKTGKEILLLQGEYVTGGKQNRMLATNIYMAQGFDGDVPVKCVEHGRWSGNYSPKLGSSERMAVKSVCYAAAVGQQEVWDQVRCLSTSHNVHSSTQNIGDIYEQRKGNTEEYLSRMGYQNGIGLISVFNHNGKRIFGLDLFDKDKTMEKHFKKIVEGYALEASSGNGNVEVTREEMAGFVENIRNASFNERKAVSLGRDYAINGNDIEGFALSHCGSALYTTFSTKRMNKPFVNPLPDFPIPEPGPWNPHHPFPWDNIHGPTFGPTMRYGDSSGDWTEKFK